MDENINLQKQIEQLINKKLDECPVCGYNQFDHMETVLWKSIKISYSICNRCSLVFQNPQMDDNNTNLFYEKYYRLFNDGIDMPTEQQLIYQQGRADFFNSRLKSYVKGLVKKENYLDIGSSGGNMLNIIKNTYPHLFKIYGIEPGNTYREISLSNGFNVFESMQSLTNEVPERFQLITMSHVLEHINDPLGFLKEIREKIIDINGLMMIEVPNYYGSHSYELSHTICFTKNTLKNVIQMAGFETVNLITHSKPNNTKRPMYLNIIIKPVNNRRKTMNYPSKLVKIKRKLAPTHNSKITSRLINLFN